MDLQNTKWPETKSVWLIAQTIVFGIIYETELEENNL